MTTCDPNWPIAPSANASRLAWSNRSRPGVGDFWEGEAPAEPRAVPLGALSGSDAELLAGQMANVTGAGLPLSAGLRALSEEVPSMRVRRWLRAISDRLERGQSLGAVAREAEGAWPRYFLAMLSAGQRTGWGF